MGNNNAKALKSGVWYTASNFLVKSIGFITTPIFARLMTKSDFGLFSNYTSWLNTLIVVLTLNLSATFISARFDFEDDFDGYISSSLALGTLSVAFGTLIINLFHRTFTDLMGIDLKFLNTMMVYLLFFMAIEMFQCRERYYFEYKVSVFLGLSVAVLTSLLSVWWVYAFEDKLLGRIAGFSLPVIIIGFVIYIIIFKNGRKISLSYWKYALPIALPYIPHSLSLTVLNSVDKMMITKICGSTDNALYSLAYSCGALITLFITSLNTAFSPWLGEKLKEEKYSEIKSFSKKYILLFCFIAFGVMLITPEILLIMGGKSYMTALYVMPPVELGCVCQFLYTMYVNIEQFKKQTIGMAIASVSAAVLNYVLNLILIPRYGYIAAAYTTLICFMWLLAVHIFLVRRIGFSMVYDNRFTAAIVLMMLLYTVLINYLYSLRILRYSFILVYAAIFGILLYKNRNVIIGFIKKKS